MASRGWDWIFETADETVVCRLITAVHYQDGFVRRILTQIIFYTLTEPLELVLWFLPPAAFPAKSFRSPALNLSVKGKTIPTRAEKRLKAAKPASETRPNPFHVVTSSCSNTGASVFKGWLT